MTDRLTEAQAALDAVRRAMGAGVSTNPMFRKMPTVFEDAVLAALENLDARLRALEDRREKP